MYTVYMPTTTTTAAASTAETQQPLIIESDSIKGYGGVQPVNQQQQQRSNSTDNFNAG